MKRKADNPFPGVTRIVDRHDKVRWRFRMKGRAPCYLPGEYASAEFRAAYEKAVLGERVISRATKFERGSFDWLIEDYIRTPTWQKLAPITKTNLMGEFDRFRKDHGSKKIAGLRLDHVEALMSKKAATPAASNKLLKLIRRLSRYAIRKRLITVDPTIGAEKYKMNEDGFHTWSDAEVLQFEAHHGVESLPVLAMRLVLYTGAARQDVAALGWQNVRGGRISYRRGKTGGEVDLPILPELADVLERVPGNQMLFITHGQGRPYKAETFGNWFHDQCVAAGLPHCQSHGLRKAGATRLANAGANELEIAAFLGHSSPQEARTYVKKADRIKLADRAMARLSGVKGEQGVSNVVERLDNARRKQLKTKEN
jgi:integrase